VLRLIGLELSDFRRIIAASVRRGWILVRQLNPIGLNFGRMKSEPQPTFSTASHWIGLHDWRDDAVISHPHPVVFLKQLSAAELARVAELKIACCLRYAVFIGDRLMHDGPARSLPGEAYVDVVPLTGIISTDSAWIAIVVMPPTGTPATEVHTRIGILAEIGMQGGTTLATDASWTVRPLDEVRLTGRVCSIPTSQQEHWTIRESLAEAWKRAAQPVRVLGSVGTPPWRSLRTRDCQLMVRETIVARPVFHGCGGGCPLPVTDDLARGFNDLDVIRVAAKDDSDEFVLGPTRNLVTFDVGRTRRVRPCVDATYAADGRLEIYYDIGLKDRPLASLGFGHAREGFVDSLAIEAAEGVRTWRPMVPRGARYVTVRYAGSGTCTVRVAIESSEYPVIDRPAPALDRPVLTEIWDRSVATLKSSCDDVLVDTCWRENTLWTFDAAVSGEAHYLAFGDPTMWRRCLGLIARWAELSGAWPTSVVPAGASGMILPDQGLVAIVAIDTYARLTGDTDFARDMVPRFEAFLGACLDHVSIDGLFVPPDWCWHWIDWAPINRRPYSLPINLLLAAACEVAQRWCGERRFSSRCGLAAARIRDCSDAFWDESGGCYRDRIAPSVPLSQPTPVVPMPTADVSAHSNALALLIGLGDERRRERVAGYLARHLEQLPFSPGWTGYVLGALVDHGQTEAALAHIERLYRPWLVAEQPTWSEGFGQTVYNTAHGWGASAISVLARVAGTRRLATQKRP